MKKIETEDYPFEAGLALIAVNAVLKALCRPEVLEIVTNSVARDLQNILVTDKELVRLQTVSEKGGFEIKKAEFVSGGQENG